MPKLNTDAGILASTHNGIWLAHDTTDILAGTSHAIIIYRFTSPEIDLGKLHRGGSLFINSMIQSDMGEVIQKMQKEGDLKYSKAERGIYDAVGAMISMSRREVGLDEESGPIIANGWMYYRNKDWDALRDELGKEMDLMLGPDNQVPERDDLITTCANTMLEAMIRHKDRSPGVEVKLKGFYRAALPYMKANIGKYE